MSRWIFLPPRRRRSGKSQEKLEAAMARIRGKFGSGAIAYGAIQTEKEEDPFS